MEGGRAENCGYSGADWINTYRTPQHWIPTESAPIKTISVNMIVCRDDQGQHGWQDTPDLHQHLEDLIDSVNYRYSHSVVNGYTMTCAPNINYIIDTKIRFRLNNVYFINNTTFNEAYGQSGAQQILDWLWLHYPETETSLNHILTMPGWDDGVSYQGYSPWSPYNGHTYVHSINLMLGDWPFYIHHLCHEYGHLVGLHHTYDSEYTTISHYDFLDDVFGQCSEPLASDPNNSCFDNCGQPNQPCPCVPTSGHICYLNGCNYYQYFQGARPLMSGNPPFYYISPKSVGRMHRALSIYNYVFRLNNTPMEKYVDEKYSYYLPYEIAANETWDFGMKMYQNLVIMPGVTLTLKCELRMPINGKIIVKQGGRLVIDGGVINCAHDGYFWEGIEAWGTTNQHQYPANNPTYQGLVVLKNGAVIKNALTGIQTRNPDNPAITSGGVIQIQGTPTQIGATFLNCQRAILYKVYQNFNPYNQSQKRPNLSSFRYAEFIVNDDYLGGDNFLQHVLLQDVDGLNFIACKFSNEQTTISESAKLGQGILAMASGFTVSGGCEGPIFACELGSGAPIPPCPPDQLHPSRFIGLDHGIRALGSGSNGRTFTVSSCSFENNVCGILTSGVNSFSILRNSFNTGNRDVTMNTPYEQYWQGHHRALYNYGGIGFRIEENTFERDPGSNPALEVEGAVMGYTGPNNVQVYKNSAQGMDHAFIAEGNCLDYSNDPTGTGLGFYCNGNTDNIGRDILIRTPDPDPYSYDHSIKLFQGSPSKSAGNSFTLTQNGAYPYFNFHNEAERLPITYFWHTTPGDLNANSYNAPWVAKYYTSSSQHNCPTRITCPGSVVELLSPQIEAERLAYLDLLYVYESLIDGGDFEELKETIMTAWPSEAWELRNELMAKSPYLSVEILKEAALKSILPDAMLLEICSANPQATKQDGFVKWIEFEAPNPLPHYMVETIIASWDEHSFRTSLEASMAQHKSDMDQMNDQLIIALRNDTLSVALDSVLVRWQANTSLGARYGEAQTLIELGRYNDAATLVNGLEVDYKLKERDAEQREDMLALINSFSEAESSGQDLMHLDESKLQVLRTTAEGPVNQASIWARNILCFGYQECYAPVTGGAMSIKSLTYVVDENASIAPHLLKVYPSPAESWVTFEHAIGGVLDNAYMLVRDITGREIANLPIAISPGQLVWDTRRQMPGTYFIELYNGGALVDIQRLILQP